MVSAFWAGGGGGGVTDDPNAGVRLLCAPLLSFKNGSLTRERLRNRCADASWERFSAALRQTPLGNRGYIGIVGPLSSTPLLPSF